MIDQTFPATLKKYENVRIDDSIHVRVVIKHINEGSVQAFLKPFSKKLGMENIDPIFTFPVRWKKMVIDTSDYIKPNYKVKFEEVEFIAKLMEISVTRKPIDGDDLFEYSLSFDKELSSDITDRLIVEAYLNYKEEDDDGKRLLKKFDVKLEWLQNNQTETEESVF